MTTGFAGCQTVVARVMGLTLSGWRARADPVGDVYWAPDRQAWEAGAHAFRC